MTRTKPNRLDKVTEKKPIDTSQSMTTIKTAQNVTNTICEINVQNQIVQ